MTTPQPYGTPDTPRIAVRGEAHLETDPDLAHLGIGITARGTDRHTTLDDLTRRHHAVQQLLTRYGNALHHTETSHLTLTPELTTNSRTERIRAYHGHIHLTATLTDFTALPDLTDHLARLELTSIDGPWWSLRPDSPAHTRARQEAVHDALRRAREYAAALGSHLTALVELADTAADHPTPTHGPHPAPHPTAFRTAGFADDHAAGGTHGSTTPTLDLSPRRQTVHAHVNARFTMTPPKL
ncbi:hypothetical protein GCM10010218_54920 [Streptomyces mashuensis]|uniref:SIMPL domain-containing protein n=1 Tax=Streptomyces mashuensis TaxID=33904 RepID=A0A919B9D0_9ACTN|nr:SIMPL domain-containing protein [Streptomyces mashuensis]GHF66383.1 hypothetical protein GCM10010218_54920 [Streptomyces mashuensis]